MKKSKNIKNILFKKVAFLTYVRMFSTQKKRFCYTNKIIC